MKKTLAIFLSMAVLLCAVPRMVFAATTTEVDGMTYTLDEENKTATLTKGKNAGELAIPDKVHGNYTVTTIGNYAFAGCSGLTSITIPNSVTSISGSAFSSCSSLTSITVDPNNPNFKFEDGAILSKDGTTLVLCLCSKAQGSYTIPGTVTTIGDSAFYNCTGLTSVTIGSGVATIGGSAFFGCGSLTTITIPDSVITIGNYAFEGCSGLTSVTIGSGVATIGNMAFYDCRGLTSVKLGSGVESISNSIKSNLLSLDTLTTINVDSANQNFKFNDGVLFNKNGTELVLYLCSKTGDSYNIPSGVQTIGDYAFYDCSNLTSVTIPSSVTTIGDCAFYSDSGSLSLGSINVDSNPNLEVKEDVLFNNADASLVLCSRDKTGSYEIPSNITTICGGAFSYCRNLTSITIPDSVTTIGDRAFYDCDGGLTSVTIGSGVQTIGDSAFYYCCKLTSITIPDSVTTVGDRAFYECFGSTSVTIGSGVQSIGKEAFYHCTGLTSI